MLKDKTVENVTPILKWVGGKRELLPEIRKYYKDLKFKNYHELFLGGGSVYIDIIKTFGEKMIERSFVNDINTDLINLVKDVKERPEELIENLYRLKQDYETYDYYFIRDRFNGVDRKGNVVEKFEGLKRSSSLIVLNRTCFNGLYRTNRKGLFNVPTGKYNNPKIVNEENIYKLSKILPPIENITNTEYHELKGIKKGDLVYFDPPYHPLTKTSSFTDYSGEFGTLQQVELNEYFKELDRKGVYVILSNSSSEFIYDLYKEFNPLTVYCGRNINSKGTGRGKVPEVIVLGNTLKKKLGL
jgi:DNA adenine methylase